MNRFLTRLGALSLLLPVTASLTGCDALEDVVGGGQEDAGLVEQIAPGQITVNATAYTVDAATTVEDFASYDAIQVGDDVEIDYEDLSGARHALTIGDNTVAD